MGSNKIRAYVRISKFNIKNDSGLSHRPIFTANINGNPNIDDIHYLYKYLLER